MDQGSSSGMTWRIAFTLIWTMLWLIFIIAWLGFGWGDFEVGENIAVVCISSVLWIGLVALVWAIWPSRSKDEDETS